MASDVVAVPPRSGVRSPSASARSTADSTAAAWGSMSSPWRSIIAADRNIASGLAAPVPAMSGAEPWTGSNRPGLLLAERCARQHADRPGEHRRLVAEDVAEHVLGQDHLEVAGRRDQLHRGVVDEQVLELDIRELVAVNLAHDLAPEPAGLEHVGLVDARDPGFRRVERDASDPLDLHAGVDAVVRSAVGRAGLLAEVDAAGELAHDHQVGALDQLALQRARVV